MKKVVLFIVLTALCALTFAQSRRERLEKHVFYFASDSLKGRAAGSEDAAKAAAYIVNEYASMGLKPFYDDWYMPITKGGKNYKNGRRMLQSDKLNIRFKNFEWSPVTATDTEGFARHQIPTIAADTVQTYTGLFKLGFDF